MNDAICSQTWTGNRKDAIGMGYVCEKHDPICVKNPNAEPLEDSEYVIKVNQGLSWADARSECKKLGKYWDLAIFNHNREHERIRDIIQDHCVHEEFAFWLGYKEYSGNVETVFGQAALPKEDGFTTRFHLTKVLNFKIK